MSRDDTLLQVKQAEQEAESIITEAKESQKAVIAAARRQAIKTVRESDDKLRAEYESTLLAEKRKVASQREAILGRGREEAERTRRVAKEKASRAKNHLKDSFVRALDAASRGND